MCSSDLTLENTIPIQYALFLEDINEEISSAHAAQDYIKWREIKDSLKDIVVNNLAYTEHSTTGEWNIVNMQGRPYIIKYYTYNNRYLCGWVDIEELVKVLGDDYIVIFSDKTGDILYNPEPQELPLTNMSELSGRRHTLFFSHMLVSQQIAKASFDIGIIIKGNDASLGQVKLQAFFIVLTMLTSIVILVVGIYFKNSFVRPIEAFLKNIEDIEETEDSAIQTQYQLIELKKASGIIEKLIDQIHSLKLAAYKQKVEEQRVRLEFLNLQIEPHFYLNCLNMIYHMVQMGAYKEVQSLTQCVSDYLRYVFKARDSEVTLGEEVEHIKRYLEIQKIRYRDGFSATIEIEEAMQYVKMPQLILQTFIENALKHTIDWEEEIQVVLKGKAQMVGDKPYLELIIEDSGEGFPSDVLEKLQNKEELTTTDGKRVGITNTLQRLQIKYGEAASCIFYRSYLGGAGIKLLIPIADERSQDNEYSIS